MKTEVSIKDSLCVCVVGGRRQRQRNTEREKAIKKHMPVCMPSLEQPSGVCSITLHLVPLRQGLSLNLQPGW